MALCKQRQEADEISYRSRRYPIETITNADDIGLLANTPAQTESQLHSQEQTAARTGFHMNTNKIECIFCERHISKISRQFH